MLACVGKDLDLLHIFVSIYCILSYMYKLLSLRKKTCHNAMYAILFLHSFFFFFILVIGLSLY